MRAQLDYQDIAMLFDRMVRAHHVDKVLGQVWSPQSAPRDSCWTVCVVWMFQARQMFTVHCCSLARYHAMMEHNENYAFQCSAEQGISQ